jgi:peptide-methionine (S)-S-oxide reductase
MIRRALAALGLALGLAGGSALAQPASEGAKTATAIFAGGCFWCMEPPFDKIEGVVSTTSGYTGGSKPDPTYQEVSAGKTGHTEALKVVYDPAKVSYERLLEVFWRNHDPLSADGQFCDKGSQYRAGIFFGNEEEKKLAEASNAVVAARFKQPIVTEIVPASTFYPAEDYHQDYYIKNPIRYKYYSTSCGRYRRLKELWGDEAGGQS